MNWYILCVRANHEKKVGELLKEKGMDVYVATQKIKRRWSDRVKVIEKVVVSRVVFVHCEDKDRKDAFIEPNMYYMMDHSSKNVAIVPDAEMDAFRVLLQQTAPVEFTFEQLKPGMKVEIVNDAFDHIPAELVDLEGEQKVVVRLSLLGCAIITLPYTYLEIVKE